MKLSILALATAVAIVSAAAFAAEPSEAPAAADGEALLKKHACIACHSVSSKMVGPSFKDIAAKYGTQKDAEKMLIEKVKKGSTGVWGQIPMPPNTTIPDADLQVIIKWVLGLK